MHLNCKHPPIYIKTIPSRKRWHRAIKDHVFQPTDSSSAIILGLCSSLLPSVIQGEMLPRTHVVIKYNARDNANLTIHTTFHDVIMSAMVPQITGISIVYSTVSSGVDHREHQSSTSLAFVRGISRSPVNWLRPKCSSWQKILSLIYIFLDQRLISLLYFIVI